MRVRELEMGGTNLPASMRPGRDLIYMYQSMGSKDKLIYDRAEQRREMRGKENMKRNSPATDCTTRTMRGTISK